MDGFDLDRFVTAQAGSFETALAEIRRGQKRTHWIWFVFPQMAGLGRSGMAQAYAIGSRAEARAYLAHPLLGARLRQAVAALQDLVGTTAEAVFGPVDAMKLRSSLTLFEAAGFEAAGFEAAGGEEAGGERLFAAALDRWFEGRRDEATLRLLSDEMVA